jgi:hypothetical protein
VAPPQIEVPKAGDRLFLVLARARGVCNDLTPSSHLTRSSVRIAFGHEAALAALAAGALLTAPVVPVAPVGASLPTVSASSGSGVSNDVTSANASPVVSTRAVDTSPLADGSAVTAQSASIGVTAAAAVSETVSTTATAPAVETPAISTPNVTSMSVCAETTIATMRARLFTEVACV